MIRNYYLLSGLVMTVISIIGLTFYIIPKQYTEVRRFNKGIREFAKGILLVEIFLVLGMVPGLPRSLQVLDQPAVNVYAKVAAVTNRLPYLLITLLLILLYNYRVKE